MADQHVERDAQLDHHRHAVGGAGRREEQAILHRQESDHLRNRLAAGDHHQERQHHARHGDTQCRARDRARELLDRRGEVEGEYDQHDADQHGRRDVEQTFDVPAHVELADQAVQDPRQERRP